MNDISLILYIVICAILIAYIATMLFHNPSSESKKQEEKPSLPSIINIPEWDEPPSPEMIAKDLLAGDDSYITHIDAGDWALGQPETGRQMAVRMVRNPETGEFTPSGWLYLLHLEHKGYKAELEKLGIL